MERERRFPPSFRKLRAEKFDYVTRVPRDAITSRKRKSGEETLTRSAYKYPSLFFFYPPSLSHFLRFSSQTSHLSSRLVSRKVTMFFLDTPRGWLLCHGSGEIVSPRLPLFNADEQLVTGWKTSYRHIDKRAPRSATGVARNFTRGYDFTTVRPEETL